MKNKMINQPNSNGQAEVAKSAKRFKIFDRMVKNAREEQIPKISEKLGKMKRGAVTEVWPKVQALWSLAKDPEGSWKAKASAIGALAYLVSPIDAIPDVIPIAGLTDDVAVILFAIRQIGPELKPYMEKMKEGIKQKVKESIEEIIAPIGENEIKSQAKMVQLSLIGAIGISAIAIALNEYFIYREDLHGIFGISAETLFIGYRVILVVTGMVSISFSVRSGYLMYRRYHQLPEFVQDGIKGGSTKSVRSFLHDEKREIGKIVLLFFILCGLYYIFWTL
jgi:uncharacterized membrane protein YkvA (DUF1232 family)